MASSFKKEWLPARMLMVLVTAALVFQLRDKLPLAALSSDASLSSAVVGMIGKATASQNKVEKILAPLEKTGSIDMATSAQLTTLLDDAAKSLQLAFNLMQSAGASAETSGFYYARLRAQETLTGRLNLLANGTGSAEAAPAATAEEAPAQAQ